MTAPAPATKPVQPAKCRVNWKKPTRSGTICNYVDEVTNACNQTDWMHCPCGGIVRHPRFEGLPRKESERIARSRPAGQIPAKFDNSEYLIGETEIDRGVVELKNLLAMGNLCQDQKDCIESLRCILRDASNRPVKQPPAPAAAVLDIKIAEYESLVTTMEKFGDDVIPGWIRAGLRNMREKKKAAIRAREAGEHSSTRGDGVRSNM